MEEGISSRGQGNIVVYLVWQLGGIANNNNPSSTVQLVTAFSHSLFCTIQDIIDKDTKNSISYQNGIEATNTALHSLLQQLRQCVRIIYG